MVATRVVNQTSKYSYIVCLNDRNWVVHWNHIRYPKNMNGYVCYSKLSIRKEKMTEEVCKKWIRVYVVLKVIENVKRFMKIKLND